MSSYWKYSELSPITPELLARFAENEWQTREQVADVLDEWPNARVVAEGRAPDIVDYNHVGLVRASEGETDKLLEKTARFFQKRGRKPAIALDPLSTPADLPAILAGRGWSRLEPAQDLMLWDPGARHIYTAAQVYSVMATNATLEEWIRIATCEDTPAIREQRTAMLRLAFRAPGTTFWFALYDGTHAGAGALFVRDGVAQVGRVLVLPEFRRKGVGLALTNFITRQSRKDGAEETYLYIDHGCGVRKLCETCGYHMAVENARVMWTLEGET
jgi:GNAT superfamily N-acetyltransferase